MVISWSRRDLFLFSLLCYRATIDRFVKLRVCAARLSVDQFVFLFLTENPVYLTRIANLSYNLCSLMYCIFYFANIFK